MHESLCMWCSCFVATAPNQLPDDKDALKAALIEAHAELSEARAKLSGAQALI